MSRSHIDRLPWYVLYTFAGIGVAAFIAGMLLGWAPPRDWGRTVMPLYFGALLAAMALASALSGNTLMHHYRTGTIQRATSPVAFRWVVIAHLVLAAALFVVGLVQLIR